jgi:hypothetical protein
VDAKSEFGNYGNHTIVVWQLKPYCATLSPIVGTIAMMVGDVTMERKVCSLL